MNGSVAMRLGVLLTAVVILGLAVGISPAFGGGIDAIGADDPADREIDACAEGPSTEVVGCWNGIEYDDELGIDQSDGLTESELRTIADRGMARVEQLREQPFKADVPVEILTREEFRDRQESGETDEEFNRWNDQVWKALFVVGEDDSSAEEINEVFGGAVAGFYSPAEDQVTIVVDGNSELQISGSTLIHELAHAMQDQYHDLSDDRYTGATQDEDLAIEGIVEGEVVYVEDSYERECRGEWECLDEPEQDDSGGSGTPNLGILQTVLQPYQDGQVLAADIVEQDGWEGVAELMEDPPETTSQVIHRDLDREPREIAFEDTATGGWELYPDQGVDGAETAGEASMYVMFWYQAFEFNIATLEPTWEDTQQNHIMQPGTFNENYYDDFGYDFAYNYRHPATDGWAGDELYPYRNNEGDEQRDGYVWVTEWQTEADAEQFLETYERMLDGHGGVTTAEGTIEIESGPFRGSYGIEHDGTTVEIVHADTTDAVFELQPSLETQSTEDPMADLDRITADAQTVAGTLDDLDERLDELEAKLDRGNTSDAVRAELTDLEDELASVETQLGSLEDQTASLPEVDDPSFESQLAETETQLANLREQATTLTDRIEQTRSQLDTEGTGDTDDGSDTEGPGDTEDASDTGVGFGPIVALVALCAVLVVVRARRR